MMVAKRGTVTLVLRGTSRVCFWPCRLLGWGWGEAAEELGLLRLGVMRET